MDGATVSHVIELHCACRYAAYEALTYSWTAVR